MGLRHVWNTGRPYTDEGQVIGAEMQDDGSVMFYDKSRGILGHVAAEDVGLTGHSPLTVFQSAVMRAYDHMLYKGASCEADAWFKSGVVKWMGHAVRRKQGDPNAMLVSASVFDALHKADLLVEVETTATWRVWGYDGYGDREDLVMCWLVEAETLYMEGSE